MLASTPSVTTVWDLWRRSCPITYPKSNIETWNYKMSDLVLIICKRVWFRLPTFAFRRNTLRIMILFFASMTNSTPRAFIIILIAVEFACALALECGMIASEWSSYECAGMACLDFKVLRITGIIMWEIRLVYCSISAVRELRRYAKHLKSCDL